MLNIRKNKVFQKAAIELLQAARDQNLLTSWQLLRFNVRIRLDGDFAEELLSACVGSCCAAFSLDEKSFGHETDHSVFQLDPDKVAQWFELLLKYLPQLIELIKSLVA